ncbi:MAG TPA: hypothetical protein VM327_03255 [Candidatus Thermoplasmatota archaeon]|nr:hypothetical protein [Candidatus Thermoplasmatota archaeon]
MLLTAYLDGVKIDLTAKDTDTILTWHETGQRFVMSDGCKKPGRIKRTFYGKFGFWHLPGAKCRHESEQHLEAKRNVATHCRVNLPVDAVQVEFPVPGHPQKIDVAVETGSGVKWALEIQRSGQTPDKTRDRTRILNDLGYMVAWFFFRRGQMVGVQDTPRAVHFLIDATVAEIQHLPPPARKRAKASKEFVAIPGSDLLQRLIGGRLKWLGRTTYTHGRRGVGTVSTFTCRCGTTGVYPCEAPPCRHLATCGFEVEATGCPTFDWARQLWSDPRVVPGGLPLATAYLTRRGSIWSRCQGCKSNIRPKRGPWGEPQRKVLEISTLLPATSVEQSEDGHWCGLAGKGCDQGAEPGKPRLAGQARLFAD